MYMSPHVSKNFDILWIKSTAMNSIFNLIENYIFGLHWYMYVVYIYIVDLCDEQL